MSKNDEIEREIIRWYLIQLSIKLDMAQMLLCARQTQVLLVRETTYEQSL